MQTAVRLPRVGVLILPTDPFWVQVNQFVAEELGPSAVIIEGGIDSWKMSPSKLEDLLDELLALELDAFIGLNLPTSFLLKMVDNGVPVISLDEAYPEYPGYPYCHNWKITAEIAGGYLAQRLAGKGRLLCIWGEAGILQYSASRIAGLKEALKPYPDITVEYIETPWPYEGALQVLEVELPRLKARPDAILGLSDSLALAARDVAVKLGWSSEQIFIAGINGDPLALTAVADGSLVATVHVMTRDLARRVANLGIQAAQGLPLPRDYSFEPQLVTRQNVSEVSRKKLMDIAMIPSRLVGINRQAEQSRLKQLEISVSFSRQLESLLDRGELLEEVRRLISANYGYDEVYFYQWLESERAFYLDSPPVSYNGKNLIPARSAGLLGEALKSREPIFVLDAQSSRRYPIDPNCPNVQSRGVLPVAAGGRLLGMLDLRGSHAVRVRRLDLLGLQVLADQVGIAMRNAELYTEALHARAEAEKADQLKTRLLANVSHELRAPLNVILGYTRVALNTPNPYQITLPDQLRADLEHVYTSGEHLIRLINDLLDLSRAEIGELELFSETIPTRSFLVEVFESLANCEGDASGVCWELELPERLPVIQADPVRLRQVMLNLLVNARQFTAAGKIVLGAQVDPPNFHFWVQDTGPGIPIEQQELIFQPFVTIERSERRSDGIGLGLSVTRRLVALHGGTITLDSSPGKGSTFHVYLPLPNLAGKAIAARREASQPFMLALSKGPDLPEGILELSKRFNWGIRFLAAGQDLDGLLREGEPVLLVWDMSQRSPKDWAVIQKLRSYPQAAYLPFLVYGMEGNNAITEMKGLTGLVTKPFSGRKLVDTISALVSGNTTGAVLIVDDDPQTCQYYRQLVEEALPGHDVRVAEDGTAALSILAAEIPDLILLDLMLPGEDGFTVLNRIRGDPRTHNAPVVIITGKVLTQADMERLDYTRVVVQSKRILNAEELANCLRRVFDDTEILPQPTSRVVKLAISHIHQSYQRALTRHALAEEVGVTESYLSKIFHQEVGISPWEYLTRFRINQAKELLFKSDESIAVLAPRVGFDDPAYFSRVFHKYAGVSPQAWRRKAG